MGLTTSVHAVLDDVDELQFFLQQFFNTHKDDCSVAIYQILLIHPITLPQHEAMSSTPIALEHSSEGASTQQPFEAASPQQASEAAPTLQATEAASNQLFEVFSTRPPTEPMIGDKQTTSTTQVQPCSPLSSTPDQTNANAHIQQPRSILSLPAELLDMVAARLDYPDLLSLKITHPYFLYTFNTVPTVRQRVSWVLRRNGERLPIPHNKQLSFRSDKAFVASREVNDILRRRRLHIECLKCQPARDFAIARFGHRRGAAMCFVTGRVCPKVVVDRESKKASYVRALTREVFDRYVYEPAPTMSVVWMVVLVSALLLHYLVPSAWTRWSPDSKVGL